MLFEPHIQALLSLLIYADPQVVSIGELTNSIGVHKPKANN